MTKEILNHLKRKANPEKAVLLSGFFKTGKGEYGEGDVFLGISVPEQRWIANKYLHLDLSRLQSLLSSSIHEHRLTALIILTQKYRKGNEKQKKEIFNFYLKNTRCINNWDLVDLSAPRIVGDYLLDKPKDILYKLAKSNSLWERRISIISTAMFISHHQYKDTLKISEILLKDKHDLIHKAVGWMLREVGKRDQNTEEVFLKKHCKTMPRTMLRYAIEKFPETLRQCYLKHKV